MSYLREHSRPSFLAGASSGALFASAALRMLGIRNNTTGLESQYSQLMFLFDGSGLNYFPVAGRGLKDQILAVFNFASKEKHDLSPGLSLNKSLIIGENCFSHNFLFRRLYSIQNLWPSNEIPYLLLLFVATDISFMDDGSSTVSWLDPMSGKSGIYEFSGNLSVPARVNDSAKFPCLVLAKAKAVGAGLIEMVSGYAQPIYDVDRWIPVDSNNERSSLACIIDTVVECQKKGIVCFGLKPTIAIDTENGPCRPDFLIGVKGRKSMLVIETMGYNTDEYVEKKNDLRRSMECIGPVFNDFRIKQSEKHRLLYDASLKKQITEWICELSISCR